MMLFIMFSFLVISGRSKPVVVVPARTEVLAGRSKYWIPACAGMTTAGGGRGDYSEAGLPLVIMSHERAQSRGGAASYVKFPRKRLSLGVRANGDTRANCEI